MEKAVIRVIKKTDAFERHEFFVALSLQQVGVVHTVEEIDYHVQESTEQIDRFLKNQGGLWIVAVTPEQKIVGELDISVRNLFRVKHNGSLTMGILKAFQGQGLGLAMARYALIWAKDTSLKRIELSVFASNIRAQNFYNKLGFMVEGRKKASIRQSDGSLEDEVIMAKYL